MGLLKQRSARGHGDFPQNEPNVPFQFLHATGEPLKALSFLRGTLGILKHTDIRWNLIPQVQEEANPVSRSPLAVNPEGPHSTESC